MNGAARAQVALTDERSGLFGRIGAFLTANGLSPDPVNYAVAYKLVSDLADERVRQLHALNDDGVRLTRREIEAFGGQLVKGAPLAPDMLAAPEPANADRLAAAASDQLDSFAAVVSAMRDETTGFGRDLAARAEAISRLPPHLALDGIAQITAAMIARVRQAEARLSAATDEAGELRAKLAEARDTARRDALTGLPNRRAFEEACAVAAEGCCVALVDVDQFKRINDAFGHGVGDRVLVAIGAALAEACPGHLVARYGGEEFAVLMTGIGLEEATDLLDGARAAVAAKRFRSRDTGEALGAITVSAGVCALARGEPIEAACARADRLLYAAKSGGRNAVVAD